MAQFFNIGQLIPTDDDWKGRMLDAATSKQQLAARAQSAKQQEDMAKFITTAAKGTHRSLYDQYEKTMREQTAGVLNASMTYGANSPEAVRAMYGIVEAQNFFDANNELLKNFETVPDDNLTRDGLQFKNAIKSGVPLQQQRGGSSGAMQSDPFRGALYNPSTGMPNLTAYTITDKDPAKTIKDIYSSSFAVLEEAVGGYQNGATILNSFKTQARTKSGAAKIAKQYGISETNVPSIEGAVEQYLSNEKNLMNVANLYSNDFTTWMRKNAGKDAYNSLGADLFTEVVEAYKNGSTLPADKQKAVFTKYMTDIVQPTSNVSSMPIYPQRGGTGTTTKKTDETEIFTQSLNNFSTAGNKLNAFWRQDTNWTIKHAAQATQQMFTDLGMPLGDGVYGLMTSKSNYDITSKMNLSPNQKKEISGIQFSLGDPKVQIEPPRKKEGNLTDMEKKVIAAREKEAQDLVAKIKGVTIYMTPSSMDYYISKSQNPNDGITYAEAATNPTLLSSGVPFVAIRGAFNVAPTSSAGSGGTVFQVGGLTNEEKNAMKRLNELGYTIKYMQPINNSTNASSLDEMMNVGKQNKMQSQQEIQTDPSQTPSYLVEP